MISKSTIWGVWSGGIFLVLFGVGLWLFADFVPPHKPLAGPDEIVAHYAEHRNSIRTGMILIMFAGSFFLPWTAMWSQLIKQMEPVGSFLSQSQLLGGATASLFFTLPTLIWQVAAFRENYDPEHVQLINDAGWLFLVTPVPPFLCALIPLGIAILRDQSTSPLLPRWFGFHTLFQAFIFVPGIMAYFFKTGPFAWDGFLAFWLPIIGFAIWFPTAMILSAKAIRTASNNS